MLLRAYPEAGAIRVDGVGIRDLRFADLHCALATAPQGFASDLGARWVGQSDVASLWLLFPASQAVCHFNVSQTGYKRH